MKKASSVIKLVCVHDECSAVSCVSGDIAYVTGPTTTAMFTSPASNNHHHHHRRHNLIPATSTTLACRLHHHHRRTSPATRRTSTSLPAAFKLEAGSPASPRPLTSHLHPATTTTTALPRVPGPSPTLCTWTTVT